MGRILLLLVLVAAAWWLYRRLTGGGTTPAANDAQSALPARRCARCGVHVPERLAEHSRGHWFCSAAHRLEFEDQRSER